MEPILEIFLRQDYVEVDVRASYREFWKELSFTGGLAFVLIFCGKELILFLTSDFYMVTLMKFMYFLPLNLVLLFGSQAENKKTSTSPDKNCQSPAQSVN